MVVWLTRWARAIDRTLQRFSPAGGARRVASRICRTLRSEIFRCGPRPEASSSNAWTPPWIKRFRHRSTVIWVVCKARAMARLEAPAAARRVIRARRATWRGVRGESRQASRTRRWSRESGSGEAERAIRQGEYHGRGGERKRERKEEADMI